MLHKTGCNLLIIFTCTIVTGMAKMSTLVAEFEPDETFDVVIELTDPAARGPAGTVTVRFCANALLTKSEYNQLLENTANAGLSPDRLAAFSSKTGTFLCTMHVLGKFQRSAMRFSMFNS